jgi:hypothetical protein
VSVRPTREGVAHTTDLVWWLADHDQDAYHDLASLIDLLTWIGGETDHARDASVYGAGGGEVHTIGRVGLGRPTEARLDFGADAGHGQRGGPGQPPVEPADRLYRDLRKLRSRWGRQLGSMVLRWQDGAEQAANWPLRTETETAG